MTEKKDIYCIKNAYLRVYIHEKGATLWSIKDMDENEYLWQGDSTYWVDRAPNLFPYIGRLTEGKYMLEGKTYEMDIHGFAKDMKFDVKQISDTHIIFSLNNNAETYKQYPYKFKFAVSYKLEDNKMEVSYIVNNQDEKNMYFGVGGHPGFNVPFEKNTYFEEYYLEFDEITDVKRVEFSEDCFVTGKDKRYSLKDGKRLQLRHDLFNHDAVVLVDMSRGVKLASDKGKRAIYVKYPSMPYLGIWQAPETVAPYVCIEPWSSLPSRKGVIEDLALQPGLISLAPNCEYHNQFTIELI